MLLPLIANYYLAHHCRLGTSYTAFLLLFNLLAYAAVRTLLDDIDSFGGQKAVDALALAAMLALIFAAAQRTDEKERYDFYARLVRPLPPLPPLPHGPRTPT